MMTIMIAKLMYVGNSGLLMAGLIATTQSFHFSTLEEYYTGGLFLGIGNGVTDGSVLIIAIFLASGIFGNQIFDTKMAIGSGDMNLEFNIGQLVVIVIFLSQMGAIGLK